MKSHMTSYTVTNLIETTEYSFRVMAENIEGMGEPLTLEGIVAPKRPASKYIIVNPFSL